MEKIGKSLLDRPVLHAPRELTKNSVAIQIIRSFMVLFESVIQKMHRL